jgi:tubulin delta
MAVVVLQVGQCGNQVGQDLFSCLHKNVAPEEMGRFFHSFGEGQSVARAVLVDTETKVISNCLTPKRSEDWRYRKCDVVVKQSGSGNNWAHGYNIHGPNMSGSVLEAIRRVRFVAVTSTFHYFQQVELCDYFGGFMLLQSAAGGTGSGVGTLRLLVVFILILFFSQVLTLPGWPGNILRHHML